MVIKQNIQNTILSDGRPALLLVEQRSGEQMLDSDWSRLFPFMPLSQSLVLWSGQCRSIIRTAWGIHKDKIFGLLILFLSIQDTRRLSVCSKLYLVQKHLCCRLNWSRYRCLLHANGYNTTMLAYITLKYWNIDVTFRNVYFWLLGFLVANIISCESKVFLYVHNLMKSLKVPPQLSDRKIIRNKACQNIF